MTLNNATTYGPCWCGGDTTTGGHQHISDYTNSIINPQQDAVLAELRAIRQLLESWLGVGEETP